MSQFDFPRNLELEVGRASLNPDWSLGTRKCSSLEAFLCIKVTVQADPLKKKCESQRKDHFGSRGREAGARKGCLQVFLLVLLTLKPGSASASEVKETPSLELDVPIGA